MPVEHKPVGYHTVTPYFVVRDAIALIDFATSVLDARESLRLPGADGRIGHAEITVGDSVSMLADVPPGGEPSTGMLYLYVEDADAAYRRALDAGATSTREPVTQFYGDRVAGVRDRNGVDWYFATHVEDVSEEEMQRRHAAADAAVAGA